MNIYKKIIKGFIYIICLFSFSITLAQNASLDYNDFLLDNVSGGGSITITVTNNETISINFNAGFQDAKIKYNSPIAYMGNLFSYSFSVNNFDGNLSFKKSNNTIHNNAFNAKIVNGWLYLFPLDEAAKNNLYNNFNNQTIIGTIVNTQSSTEDFNTISITSFDMLGTTTAKSKSYFNNLGKKVQLQTLDIKTNKIWGNEILYDSLGRAVLQTLSAPITNGSLFLFKEHFIKKNNGSDFSNIDFENNEYNPSPVGNQPNSLGWYYSDNNTNEEYQDVTNYPFSRTIYSKLNPGAVLKTIGGNKVSINGQPEEWISGFSYTVPAAQELYYAFGKGYFGEEGVIEESEAVITKFYKSVSIDVHGIESVVFTDGEGKILAAARSGGDTKYDVVSVIGEQGFVDIHIPQGISNNDIQILGNTNNYKIFNLRTEEIVNASTIIGGNFYRIEYLGVIENYETFIAADGSITTPNNAKGIRYKVNYYDYTLNYYDKVGRLLEATQPIGFDENSLDLTAEFPNHQMKSTYKYNAQNQLLETTSPDEGRANFIYREDGQIRLSQNTKQAAVEEFSYTNYDEQARPIESGVYNGPLSFSENAYKQISLTDITDIKQEGNIIKKIPTNAWDSGIASIKMISGNGYVQWKFNSENNIAIVGLSSVNANYSYNTVHYGLFANGGNLFVYQSGTNTASLGSFTANDILKVERQGSAILYKKNGTTIHTTNNVTSANLLADIALNDSNSKIIDFEMGGNLITPSTSPYKYSLNISTSGTVVTKTSGLETKWDAGFHSSEIISGNGTVSWTVNQNNKLIMMGLSSETAVATPYYSFINYAVYMHSNGNLYVYEKGNNKGSFGAYSANDTFKVERIGSQIKYFKNGALFYTSNVSSFNEDLIAYSSFRNLNGAISNTVITGGELKFKDFSKIKTSGNKISKIAANSWNAAFASNETINGDGYVKFLAVDNKNSVMVGLSETNASNSFNTIDFAIYLYYNGRVYIYEAGVPKGYQTTYQAGDEFKVERTSTNGTVKYYKNNQLLYTSLTTTTQPLLIDTSFYTSNASIQDLGFYDLVNPSSVVTPTSNFDASLCKERLITIYDTPEFEGMQDLYTALQEEDINESYYRRQNFVAGNVAKTYTINPNTTTTWYSYDIYSRVEWVVQKIDGLGTKTIDYEYDPVKGFVTKVIYQKHKLEELFAHRYEYNTVGQLIRVETSKDNQGFEEHAKYEYYETGALKRTVLSQISQGIDYVYNLAGQLKAINHPSLRGENDPGGDTNDIFGMHIDYYNGDYTRTNTPTPIVSSPSGNNRYDGNIKATRWATRDLDENPTEQQNAYTYRYNNNKWLHDATYGSANNEGLITPNSSNSYLVSNLTYDANGNLLSLNRNKNLTDGSVSMDEFRYTYNASTNQLNYVDDAISPSNDTDDLNTQNQNNYIYNSIGQLVQEILGEHIINYIYNASGLITSIKKDGEAFMNIYYNDKGQRVRKETTHNQGESWNETFYVRDISGSVMAIYTGFYDNETIEVSAKEHPIYGVSRLGVWNRSIKKSDYELTDHLGNVRAVVSSGNNLNSYTDYYPFGMPMPNRRMVNGYRYAFQGQELDPETGKEAFQLRMWDSRIGRWTTTDPYQQYESPYLGMGNNPISRIDPDGGSDCPPPCIQLDEVVLTQNKKYDALARQQSLLNEEINALKKRLIIDAKIKEITETLTKQGARNNLRDIYLEALNKLPCDKLEELINNPSKIRETVKKHIDNYINHLENGGLEHELFFHIEAINAHVHLAILITTPAIKTTTNIVNKAAHLNYTTTKRKLNKMQRQNDEITRQLNRMKSKGFGGNFKGRGGQSSGAGNSNKF